MGTSMKVWARMVVLLLMAAALAATSWGCNGKTRGVPFHPVGEGTDSTYGSGGNSQTAPPLLRVIADDAGWDSFVSEFLRTGAAQSVQRPDFSREFAVAVLQGNKPTGGYAISLMEVTQQEETVSLRTRLTEPESGAILIQVITSPYAIYSMDRQDLEPRGDLRFQMLDENGDMLAEARAGI